VAPAALPRLRLVSPGARNFEAARDFPHELAAAPLPDAPLGHEFLPDVPLGHEFLPDALPAVPLVHEFLPDVRRVHLLLAD